MPIRRRAPNRRTYRRPVRRRTYKRPRYARKVPRLISLGVPKYRYAKLSYCDLLAASVNTSSFQGWAYQSSLYDPYVAVGGHQPMFFDQYAAMYGRYTVMGMAYDIQACTDAATNGPIVLTLMPSNVGSSASTISIARERAGTKESIVSHGYKARLKGYISVAKTLGVDKRKLLTDDQYSAVVSSNPSQMAYVTLQAWNNSGTAAIAIYITIRLTYYCRFFDPTEPAQS